jgi:hypothetical protein
MADRYNGWTNYETWDLKLWIDNDQGLAEHWQEAARTAVDDTDETDDSDTRKREAAVELAEQLRIHVDFHAEVFMEMAVTNEGPAITGFYADLITHALGAIDYREIAESLLKDLDDD